MKYLWLLVILCLMPFMISCKKVEAAEECLEDEDTTTVECLEGEEKDSDGDVDIVYPDGDSTMPAGYTVLANGRKIGSLSTGKLSTDRKFYFHTDFQGISIYKNGTIRTDAVYLKNRDCLGTPYSRHVGGMIDNYNLLVPPLKGEVFIYQEFIYYYAAGDSTFYYFQPRSIYTYDPINGGYCKNLTSLNYDVFIKLRPNNPAVTGIPEYPFESPVEIKLSKPVIVIQD